MIFYPPLSLHGKNALRSSESETETEKQKCEVIISSVHLDGIAAFLQVNFTFFPKANVSRAVLSIFKIMCH